mmetsp:Transcript_18636/g.40368  ORF Transcript_18636/g.40368 Transcript_18636/m.40368 type:complete len:145 (-) Transcript_18636:192-626(-)
MLPRLPGPRRAVPGEEAEAASGDGRAWGEDGAAAAGGGDDRKNKKKEERRVIGGFEFYFYRRIHFWELFQNEGIKVWRWGCSGVLSCVGLNGYGGLHSSNTVHNCEEGRSRRRLSTGDLSVSFRSGALCGFGSLKGGLRLWIGG